MRAVLSGGGTAGHINPALSIAKKILEKEPNSEILFIGTEGGMENRLVTREGFPIRHVEVMGFRRKLCLENLKVMYLAVKSVSDAKKILKEFRPDVVIGTGGYVSWPVVRAASKMKIPTLIHEQNAVPGVTTSRLSRYADRVCLSFADSETYFHCDRKKLILTGNPVNPEIGKISRTAARSKIGVSAPYLLSYGGSLGAKVLNEAAYHLAKHYSQKRPIFHTHAFGQREYEFWNQKAQQDRICRFGNVEFCDYIYDMPMKMAAADLVICRAGAITLAELALMGKPAILIPSPNVTNNHQYKNAAIYRDRGAAILIEDADLNGEKLITAVDEILSSPEKLREMSKAMLTLANPDADEKIWREIRAIVK